MSVSKFHDSHREAWERDSRDETRRDIHASWLRTDTADYWRHARMYEPARAFLHRPDLKFVTIGDGRFGLDSIRLRRLGFRSVFPTDIGDALLAKAKADGLIPAFGVENAEHLSFSDDEFDVAFCKESYHHCPRGPLALYEMLRVSRHAVILVEPRDYVIDHGPVRSIGPAGLLRGLVTWLRYKLNRSSKAVGIQQRYLTGDAPHYEESGNYMYTISSRELEKVALGMNLPAVAFKGLNDSYVEGGEHEPANESSAAFREMRSGIDNADKRSDAGRGSTSMLMAILFKEPADPPTVSFLREHEWLYTELPCNPHIPAD